MRYPWPIGAPTVSFARLPGRGRWCGLALLLLQLVLLGGCHEPEITQPMQDPVLRYPGTWEYRYGDSPTLPGGALAFATPSHDDGGWLLTKKTWTPAGRNRAQSLWLRTHLTGPTLFDPVLYSRSVDYLYEAYLDGKLIAHLGKIPPTDKPHIGGTAPLFLRLPQNFAGRTLTLHLYSNYRNIGLVSPVLLGGRMELLLHLMRKDFTKPLVGFLLISFAVVGLLTFFIRRREQSFLYFFGFSLSAGVFVCISRNSIRHLISARSDIWWSIELISLCFVGVFLCGFFQNVFGPGPWRLNRRLKWAFITFFCVATGLVIAGVAPALYFLDILQMLLLTAVVYLAAYCFVIAWLGNIDARIFGVGFFIATIPVIYDLSAGLGALPGQIDSPAFSSLIVVMTLIILLSQRFLALNHRLLNLSAVLQLNLASASQLDDAQQAKVALTQVLTLLPVMRATLFLAQPETEQLQWVSSRDHSGPVGTTPLEGEQKLAQAVAARGRSLTGRAGSISSDAAAAADDPALLGMPLRAQGQLVGVLCIALQAGREELTGDDGELLAWLGNQFGLSLMTSRALRLEMVSALDRRRLAEQSTLLEAAARLARGDLESPIAPALYRDLSSLAEALETMRQDLQAKFETLQEYNREIHELNEELRHQIDQRSRRVLDLALKREDQRDNRKAHYVAGAILGEHYRVIRLVGQGTMGSVYEVERTTDGKHLAAKVLTPRADKLTMVRFAREAQILARLKHPNLISIFDIDVTDSGVLFLVMELIVGTTLKLCQERYGDLRFVLPVLRQMAKGLAAIHAAGIVHRDLKPANVLIAKPEVPDRPPMVKLVDFGISTLASADGKLSETEAARRLRTIQTTELSVITGPQALASATGGAQGAQGFQGSQGSAAPIDPTSTSGIGIGTPMYMAPESGQRGSARPTADIWSFGVIAFEILTRELPFLIPPLVEASDELSGVPSLAEKRPDLPAPIAAILQRCLLGDPAQRPAAETIAAALSSGRASESLTGV